MSSIGVIPARFASSRLPGKPLADIAGMSLLQRVWSQTSQARSLDKVLIATDDERIARHAETFGARAVMTSVSHVSGTDRVAEVARSMEAAGEPAQLVVNVQGDMPFLPAAAIDRIVGLLSNAPRHVGIATIAVPIRTTEEFFLTSAVKVVLGSDGDALYFSRAAIPCDRDGISADTHSFLGLKHVGLYAYRATALDRLSKSAPPEIENRERLEQLRALYYGIGIRVAVLAEAEMGPSIEVDTPQDLERARAFAERTRSAL